MIVAIGIVAWGVLANNAKIVGIGVVLFILELMGYLKAFDQWITSLFPPFNLALAP